MTAPERPDDCIFCKIVDGDDARPRSSTPTRPRWPSATSTRRHPRTCWWFRAATTRTPPSWPTTSPPSVAALVQRGLRGRRRRGPRRGLPLRLQHRRRCRPDRLPRPPARPRWPLAARTPRMSARLKAASVPPRRRARSPRAAQSDDPSRRRADHGHRDKPATETPGRRVRDADRATTVTRAPSRPRRSRSARASAARRWRCRRRTPRQRRTAPGPTTTAASCSTPSWRRTSG